MAERDTKRSRLNVELPLASQFPELFRHYYSIHETIHSILSENGGSGVDTDEVARRVREQHPDLDMPPETLSAAIRQAKADNPHAARSL